MKLLKAPKVAVDKTRVCRWSAIREIFDFGSSKSRLQVRLQVFKHRGRFHANPTNITNMEQLICHEHVPFADIWWTLTEIDWQHRRVITPTKVPVCSARLCFFAVFLLLGAGHELIVTFLSRHCLVKSEKLRFNFPAVCRILTEHDLDKGSSNSSLLYSLF